MLEGREERLLGELLPSALATPNHHLGNRFAVVQRDQHVVGFDVAMNDPF